MRMLGTVEPGTLAPPQPWRGAELFSLAAGIGVNAAKPHQGAASKKPALHQGQIACNSTTALGLSWSWQSGTAPGAGVTYDYDAWGNLIESTGSTTNVYLYQGEQYDSDLGLYYLRARYFNPLTGRFLTRDTYESDLLTPAGLHRYLYGDSDPVNRTDPTGRSSNAAFLLNAGGFVLLMPDPIGHVAAAPANPRCSLSSGKPPSPNYGESFVKNGVRYRMRQCKPDEMQRCKAMCGTKGVAECSVLQRFGLKQQKGGLGLRRYIDGPMSCSCNEEKEKCKPEPVDPIPYCGGPGGATTDCIPRPHFPFFPFPINPGFPFPIPEPMPFPVPVPVF